MAFDNRDKVAFANLTEEQQRVVTQSLICDRLEVWSDMRQTWVDHTPRSLHLAGVYRTRCRSLDIPWQVIHPRYKFAAMDASGKVWVYVDEPVRGAFCWTNRAACDAAYLAAIVIDTTDVDWRFSITARQ